MQHIAAVLLPTLASPVEGGPHILVETQYGHEQVWREAELWRRKSSNASLAELIADTAPLRTSMTYRVRDGDRVTKIPAGSGTPPRTANRVLEILGLMGAIGEQLGLAWTAEQDVQRVIASPYDDDEGQVATTMHGRALSELAGHFILSASNGLANLAPGSESRSDWVFFDNKLTSSLKTAAHASTSDALKRIVGVLDTNHQTPDYQNLSDHRGIDYH